jgi:hypothetical protein
MPTQNVWSRHVALSLYVGAVAVALGAPAELDPTFGTNGLVRIDVKQTDDAAAAVFAQADGDGRTVFDVASFHSRTFSVLAQSDGEVLAGGWITPDHGPVVYDPRQWLGPSRWNEAIYRQQRSFLVRARRRGRRLSHHCWVVYGAQATGVSALAASTKRIGLHITEVGP